MTESWGNMIYLGIGIVTGAVFAIEFTKRRWWSPSAMSHYHSLQDLVLRYEIRNGRSMMSDFPPSYRPAPQAPAARSIETCDRFGEPPQHEKEI